MIMESIVVNTTEHSRRKIAVTTYSTSAIATPNAMY